MMSADLRVSKRFINVLLLVKYECILIKYDNYYHYYCMLSVETGSLIGVETR